MRIDQIANNEKYRKDELFQNLTISKIIKFSLKTGKFKKLKNYKKLEG